MRYTLITAVILAYLISTSLPDVQIGTPARADMGNETPVWPYSINHLIIDSEQDLMDQASDNGWPGDGTSNSPYLISNYTFDGTSQVAGIYIGNTTSHITIANCTIKNVGASTSIGEQSHAILLQDTDHVTINGCNISDSAYGISVNLGDLVNIENSTITKDPVITGYGILLSNSEYSTVYGCNISGFEVNMMLQYSTACAVYSSNLTHSSSGVMSSNSLRTTMRDNHISPGVSSGLYGIHVFEADRNLVSGNRIEGFTYNIYVDNCYDAIIRENVIEGGSGGIFIENGERNLVESNTLMNGTGEGIEVTRRGQTIRSNLVHGYGGVGIDWIAYGSMSLDHNRVENNSQGGIYVGGSSSYVMDNTVTGNGGYGIAVSRAYSYLWYDRNIVVSNNQIVNNFGPGIYINNRDANRIYGNLIYNNTGYGMDIQRANMDNSIYNNTFMFNSGSSDEYDSDHIQVRSISSNDDWREGNRGNYWHDWTGPDDDGNGIVDSQYTIDPDLSIDDPYPLTRSFFLPQRPINLTANVEGGQVRLSWSPPGSYFEITDYILYRSEIGGILEPVATIGSPNTSCVDMTSELEKTYIYAICAESIIGAGEMSGTVMIETPYVPPGVRIVYPTQEAILNTYNFYLRWEAWDNESGLENIQIRLFDDEWMDVGEATSYQFQKLLYDTGRLELEGNFTFSVRAIDGYGGQSEHQVTFRTDTTPPDIDLLSPSSDVYYRTRSVEVSWTAADTGSGISGYEVRLDDGEWTDVGMNGSFNAIDLHDGLHDIGVRAYDGAGNFQTGEVRFSVDMTPPELEIVRPIRQYYFNVDVLRLEWEGRDHFSGIDHYTWGPLEDAQSDIGKENMVVLEDLKEGEHTYWVFAYDRAGNINKTSVDLFIDLYKPELEIIFPQDGGIYNSKDLSASWHGADTGSGIDRYEYYLDSEEHISTLEREVLLEGLDEGKHTITVLAFDQLGNVEQRKASFKVDTVAPFVISFNPDEDGAAVDQDIGLIFSEPMNTSSVRVFWDILGLMTWVDQRMLQVSHPALEYGVSYTLKVAGTDIAGNPMRTSVFTFNTTDTGYVSGRVIDENGYPISGGQLDLDGKEVSFTNGTGHFIIQGRAGNHSLFIHSQNHGNRTVQLSITAGEETDLGDIMLVSGPVNGTDENLLIWLLVSVLILVLLVILLMFFFIWKRSRRGVDFGHEDIKVILDQIRTSHGMMTADEIENTDFYNILGLKKRANQKEIRKAYRTLAAKHHPDRLSHLSGEEKKRSEDQMVKINMAKAVLMDQGSKGAYDHYLETKERMKRQKR